MKHRLKGLLALVLSLVMVLSMVTVGSASQQSGSGSEPTTYPVKIGDVEFASNNLVIDSTDIAGVTGSATYVPTDGTNPATLTLNNFVLEYNNYSAIKATGDLTINLKGTNTVSTTTEGSYSGGDAILVNGDLTIKGENGGSLNASSDVHDSISANNITIDKANLTVGCLYGLNADHGTGTVTISNGSKLTINATTGAINCSTLNFGGNWYQWSTDGTNFNNSTTSALSKDAAKGIANLYIKPITYTVTYANGGGTGTDPTQTSTAAGGTFTLAQNPYTKSGYAFAGWNDGANTYAAGATYTMPANDVILTAQWTENSNGAPGSYWVGPINISSDDSDKSTDKVESVKTFDSGVAIHIGLTILAASGSAWLAKKKD